MTPYLEASAEIEGAYRYRLRRRWAPSRPFDTVAFVMLNPSTADGTEDDPTIRRCVGFARRWGFGALEVVNLYAIRATDPMQIQLARFDPVGPRNNAAILEAVRKADRLVCAWGAHPAVQGRDLEVFDLLLEAGAVPRALGITKTGYPRHPLYVRADVELVDL